jgi:hypothetical protein
MSKLLTRLTGIVAAGALALTIGVASASANVTRYHEANGTVTINTPNVAATVGTQTQAPFTVSVSGPSPLKIANEKFLTAYGWGDSQWEGLSFAHYGCWGVSLYSGQSCTDTIAYTPFGIGRRNEAYMLATGIGTLYGKFTATGIRRRVIPPVVASAGSLAS